MDPFEKFMIWIAVIGFVAFMVVKKGYKIFVNAKAFGYHDYDNTKAWVHGDLYKDARDHFLNKWGNRYSWI